MQLFTLIFSILISLVCFWMSCRLSALYLKVKSWQKIAANVISKKVELHKKVSTSRAPYGLMVEYKYYYQGKEYFNDKVQLVELIKGQSNYMESTAVKKMNTIKNEMTIYVNPKNPQESVMFCSGILLYVFIFFMGLMSLLIGLSNYSA